MLNFFLQEKQQDEHAQFIVGLHTRFQFHIPFLPRGFPRNNSDQIALVSCFYEETELVDSVI